MVECLSVILESRILPVLCVQNRFTADLVSLKKATIVPSVALGVMAKRLVRKNHVWCVAHLFWQVQTKKLAVGPAQTKIEQESDIPVDV